jgi:hypothetical protein
LQAIGQFVVVSSPLVLFDSADPGDLREGFGLPRVSVAMTPDEYRVSCGTWSPDDQTTVNVVRLAQDTAGI